VRIPLSILALVLVVTGCSSGTPQEPVRIDGVEWRATSIDGMVPPFANAPTLTITGGSIKGSSGCNSYGGTVRLDDGRLVTGDLQTTLRACLDDRANEIERRFMAILGSRPRIGTRQGQLVLAGDAGEIVLTSPGIFVGPTNI
jgi:heat shock protein HslJ